MYRSFFYKVDLNLKGVGLRGKLPDGLWDLTKLERLHLGDNRFTGTISASIGQLSKLKELFLQRSGVNGELPSSLGALENLEVAYFNFNNLKGDVPEAFCEMPSLRELQADCDKGGKVDCPCCTQCCSKKPRERCRDPDV